jgi:hypothetical protein
MAGIREQFVETAFEAPRGHLELRVAKIQAEVLDVDRIGRADSFYDFGGTSLQAIRICARVERDVGCKALPVWLFESDVLSDFVERIEAAVAPSAEHAHDVRGNGTVTALSDAQAHYRLSFAQQRLWLMDQLKPGTDYNVFEAHSLRGDLNVQALRAALGDATARHTSLRTTCYAMDGVPYLRVADSSAASFELKEVAAATDADLTSVIQREAHQPFDLETGPLLRMKLLRLGAAHHILVVVAHHIIVDDRSMEILWRDLSIYYRARANDVNVTLAPLTLDYANYAACQRDKLRGEALETLVDHWRSRLEGSPLVLELPTDMPRTEMRESANALVRFYLPAATAQAVTDLAAKAHATAFMVLLAAFSVTIRFAAGQGDFLIGAFAANRSSAETEDMIGLFVNLLPLRIKCNDGSAFIDLISQVRSTALETFRDQELPFDQLVAVLRPPRELTRNPVVQVAFESFGSRSNRLSLPGITSTLIDEGQGGNALDLLVIIEQNGDGLSGELHYRADLFKESTALGLAESYTRILSAATIQPDRMISDLRTIS